MSCITDYHMRNTNAWRINMARKKRPLKDIYVDSGIKHDYKPNTKKPKSTKDNGYISKEELGREVGVFIKNIENMKFTKCRKCRKCEDLKCANKLIHKELSDMIWKMCTRIALIKSFRLCLVADDLPSTGYLTVIDKLKNSDATRLESSFSYITTIIKRAYMMLSKAENNNERIKVIYDKDVSVSKTSYDTHSFN